MDSHEALIRGASRIQALVLISLVTVIAITSYAAAMAMGASTESSSVWLTGPQGWVASRNDAAVTALSGLAFALGLWRLMNMFKHIRRGELFARATIAELRGFTSLVLISAVISIALPAIMAVLEAATSRAAERVVTLTFHGGDFFSLLIAALLFFVARLLGEAQRIAEDSSQIV